MSGLTSTGFVAATLEEIKEEIETELLATVDPGLDLSPDQPMGQIVGIVSQREAKLWELLAVAYGGADPAAAESFLLDGVCDLTGTTRLPATKSSVTINCGVDNNFSAAVGALKANVSGSPLVLFKNKSAVGPLTPAGTYPIVFEATEYGPTQALAGTLTVITAPVGGWNTATNPLDATLGRLTETDAALAIRREEELSKAGACTVDSLRADLLEVTGVQQAFVFENTSLVTNSDGMPGKSFEAVIFDGTSPAATNADIAKVVWEGKPSGIEMHGTTSVNHVDATGVTRVVKFSRATVRQVWLEFDLTIDANTWPATGATLVKAAVALAGASALNLGIDVVAARVKAWAFGLGVLDVTALRLGFAVSPVGTSNLTITGRQIASLDTSRMTVATTAGTP